MANDLIPGVLDRVRRHLVGLKMPRALETLDATLRQLECGELSSLEAIERLLGDELATRETRRIKMALMTARLTAIKTLSSFDFTFQPSLDRNRILALAELEFVARKEVVHFLGPPGTGKTHLALALGVEAVKAGKSVYFGTLADIVSSLLKAEREGQLRERIRFVARNALLIIDEIGYLPLSPGGANLFFQLAALIAGVDAWYDGEDPLKADIAATTAFLAEARLDVGETSSASTRPWISFSSSTACPSMTALKWRMGYCRPE
jgi:DNA replication protein DnaC